jgi:hypothetical protein
MVYSIGLKTWTSNYKWQKTPVPSIFLNDFESQAKLGIKYWTVLT